MNLINTILLLVLILTSVSYGQVDPESLQKAIRGLSIQEKAFFDSSLASCKEHNQRKFYDVSLTPHEKQVLVGTFSDSLTTVTELYDLNWREGTKVFKSTRGLGMQMYELLNSDGFMYAMKVCFPNDFYSERMYVLNLFLIDAAVKGVVMGVTILSPARLWNFLKNQRYGIGVFKVLSAAQGGYWIFRGGQKILNPETQTDDFSTQLNKIDEFLKRTEPKK